MTAETASGSLTGRHFLLALLVMAIWGTNFVISKVALSHLPPLLFAAFRFTLAFLPAAVFVKRPAGVTWRNLAAYGVLIGVGQFGIMFFAMSRFISPGLASLVIQMQAFFTIALAAVLMHERLRPYQFVALGLCALGLVLIISRTDASATPVGVVLMLAAGLSWACANLVSRANGKVDMLGYVVWASVFSLPPLFALSFLFEGWPAISAGLRSADLVTWTAVVWQAVGNTLFGYAVWSWLLARYPAASIAPMSLLVPVFGMGTSALVLHEPLPAWKLEAAGLLLVGLLVNQTWPTLQARFSRAR